MKRYLKLLFISIILITGCNDTKKETESVKETAIESSELDMYSDKFRRLMVTEDGVLRGFTFITDSSEIKRNETAQFLSTDPSEMTFTIEFNELEMADIIYHLKANEVDTFELDLYLKNKEATDSLVQDFRLFYTGKYGKFTTQGDSLLLWKDSVENVGVKLKYINEEFDHGINVYLYKNSSDQEEVQQ
ncbi:MAG TPA: hypothetical protein VD908_10815 [Cytophagales bacterium]|nr:hypothetical protein [Cytophagales bacterium]